MDRYKIANSIDEANALAREGWRIVHVVASSSTEVVATARWRGRPTRVTTTYRSYVMEREAIDE